MFQSTHPRRVRPNIIILQKFQFSSFNPRTHVGCDELVQYIAMSSSLFQSTHPRRVRLHILQKAEYQCAKIIILRKTAKKIRIKYHKRYIICKSLIFRRCETIDYFAIL